jgi:hypothetical protein
MKYIFSVLIFLHAAINLMGFIKAYNLVRIDQLSISISRISGLFWLLAFLLFVTVGISYLAKADWWYWVAFLGIIISSILIITVWSDSKYGMLANIIILFAAVVTLSARNFERSYEKEVKKELSLSASLPEPVLTESDLEGLPEPVKRYIRYTGSVGKPKVNNFRVEFSGKIRKNEQTPWMPLTSVQYNFMEVPTRLFFMKAVMKALPVAGFHRFVNGEAYMDIRALSLIKVQFQSGKEMGIAETVTFFNDMAFMAPATLIDKRIRWIESDRLSASAEFTNNGITISAKMFFNDKGELVNFISEDRYAADDKGMLQLPWSTPSKQYSEVDGFRLSVSAETIYSYPDRDLCYGVFNLEHVEYNCKSIK